MLRGQVKKALKFLDTADDIDGNMTLLETS